MQQTNIALISALLLTIQFSFAYTLPQIWGPMTAIDSNQTSYLAKTMSPDQIDTAHEVNTISIINITVNKLWHDLSVYFEFPGDSGRDHKQFGVELHVYDILRSCYLGGQRVERY
jgi:hypothetical protein